MNSHSYDLLVTDLLGLDIEGRPAELTIQGCTFVLVTDFPYSVMDQVAARAVRPDASMRDRSCAVGRLADRLQSLGLQLDIRSSGETIVSLGRPGSRLSRSIAGSSSVQIHRRLALVPIGVRRVCQPLMTMAAAIPTNRSSKVG